MVFSFPYVLSITNPVLVSGQGFSGVTLQPSPLGSSQGFDANVIVQFDSIPYQDVLGGSDFNIGVVAFHSNGIALV